MVVLKAVYEYFWKSTLCGMIYVLSIIIAGGILIKLGGSFPDFVGDMNQMMFWVFVSGMLLSLVIGFILKNTGLSFIKRYLAVVALLLLNSIAQVIEARFYSPGLITREVAPTLLGQNTITALLVSLAIAALFKNNKLYNDNLFKTRRIWYEWVLRFFVSAASYGIFYYIFGMISFALFTGEYYRAGLNGLAVPETSVILTILPIRAVLLVASIVPLTLSMVTNLKNKIMAVGMALFIIGGLNPMLQQIGNLPAVLIAASTVEMFFQNFFCGLVTAIAFTKDFKKNRQMSYGGFHR